MQRIPKQTWILYELSGQSYCQSFWCHDLRLIVLVIEITKGNYKARREGGVVDPFQYCMCYVTNVPSCSLYANLRSHVLCNTYVYSIPTSFKRQSLLNYHVASSIKGNYFIYFWIHFLYDVTVTSFVIQRQLNPTISNKALSLPSSVNANS